MKKKIIAVLLLVTLIIITGCAAKVDVNSVRKYADPMVENLLVAMNNADYNAFSKDFDSIMKKSLPETKFPSLLKQINGKIGKYIPGSKQFEKAYKVKGFVNVVYKARFTNETDFVTVRVVFKDENGTHKITGLWFNSPKLRQK